MVGQGPPYGGAMFEGFEERYLETSGARIRVRIGGEGPALVLLHGNPQTSAMWRHVAARLKDRYRLICPDLRGYGFSSKPPPGERHVNYSKREMARDVIELMDQLGHAQFFLAGHDRGGRVAHRLAYDWPERVRKLAVLDIAPTREMYQRTDQALATLYWHWFFMIQPSPIPERMFGADPEFTLREKLSILGDMSMFGDGAWEEYLEAFKDPETIRGTCEDYRAAVGIDIEHDDAETGKVAVPLLCLWGKKGVIERCFEPLALWRLRAEDVTGWSMSTGHYMAEEDPEGVADALARFFT